MWYVHNKKSGLKFEYQIFENFIYGFHKNQNQVSNEQRCQKLFFTVFEFSHFECLHIFKEELGNDKKRIIHFCCQIWKFYRRFIFQKNITYTNSNLVNLREILNAELIKLSRIELEISSLKLDDYYIFFQYHLPLLEGHFCFFKQKVNANTVNIQELLANNFRVFLENPVCQKQILLELKNQGNKSIQYIHKSFYDFIQPKNMLICSLKILSHVSYDRTSLNYSEAHDYRNNALFIFLVEVILDQIAKVFLNDFSISKNEDVRFWLMRLLLKISRSELVNKIRSLVLFEFVILIKASKYTRFLKAVDDEEQKLQNLSIDKRNFLRLKRDILLLCPEEQIKKKESWDQIIRRASNETDYFDLLKTYLDALDKSFTLSNSDFPFCFDFLNSKQSLTLFLHFIQQIQTKLRNIEQKPKSLLVQELDSVNSEDMFGQFILICSNQFWTKTLEYIYQKIYETKKKDLLEAFHDLRIFKFFEKYKLLISEEKIYYPESILILDLIDQDSFELLLNKSQIKILDLGLYTTSIEILQII